MKTLAAKQTEYEEATKEWEEWGDEEISGPEAMLRLELAQRELIIALLEKVSRQLTDLPGIIGLL